MQLLDQLLARQQCHALLAQVFDIAQLLVKLRDRLLQLLVAALLFVQYVVQPAVAGIGQPQASEERRGQHVLETFAVGRFFLFAMGKQVDPDHGSVESPQGQSAGDQ
ncbi:hypothetical protein ACFSQE_11395 [Vogesella fluminis]|uniref:hypothetical protein n=1 Tax=Vogesella fluminis TaxID=1069161 RepID=UPI00363AB19A